MRIEFSEHAEDRIHKRKIPRARIRETIQNPDEALDSFRGRKLRRKRFGDKILEIVTVTEEDKIVVITQYYLGEENAG